MTLLAFIKKTQILGKAWKNLSNILVKIIKNNLRYKEQLGQDKNRKRDPVENDFVRNENRWRDSIQNENIRVILSQDLILFQTIIMMMMMSNDMSKLRVYVPIDDSRLYFRFIKN